jgi:hypothetical protein
MAAYLTTHYRIVLIMLKNHFTCELNKILFFAFLNREILIVKHE